jgi:hypothetical protein
MDKKLEISENYLILLIKQSANKTVGELMSLHETISNPEELKRAVKNSIYQNFRDFEATVKAFDYGIKFYPDRSK